MGRKGFTLVETVVAMAVLMIIVTGTFSAVSFACSTSVAAEDLNTARNIANYSLDFIRSRNVTRQDPHGFTSGWYGGPGTTDGGLPGIIDLAGQPLRINSNPVCPGDAGSEAAGSYSSLQGYVSLRDPWTIPLDEDDPWEPNAHVRTAGTTRRYEDAITGDPYIIRFPLGGAITTPAPIRAFAVWGDYGIEHEGLRAPTVWGLLTLPDGSPDAHCTTSGARKEACYAYRGYRVLTQMVARSDDEACRHVQTYDVRVTVLWMVGTREHQYAIRASIATY